MTLPTQKDVLDFWFRSMQRPMPRFDIWFKKSNETDALIRERFEPLVNLLASGRAYEWAADGPMGAAAAIIALDQFSRNIWRNSKKAFANDGLALSLTNDLILFGHDQALHPLIRWFVYMPLEHSEDMDEQRASLAAFRSLVKDAPKGMEDLFQDAMNFAQKHADVIARFGRYPHRNALLGRRSTPEETAWLETNGGF